MHPPETHQRFIQWRAQGRTFASIADELQVAMRTLAKWQHLHAHEIEQLRYIELEAQNQKYCPTRQEELARLATHLNRIETILAQRKLECLTTGSLFRLATSLRSQLNKHQALPTPTWKSSPASPAAEPPAPPATPEPATAPTPQPPTA